MNSITTSRPALPPICVVLVETSDPGNIGASARAMKNMGVTDLRLVNPIHFPHPKALWRSKYADDLVHQAKVFTSLTDAIADCQLAVATSARSRALPWPSLSPRQLASHATDLPPHPDRAPIALIFGREKSGLRNDELQLCQWHCAIPANPAYPVLNLSHAVQLLCYELWDIRQPQPPQSHSDQPLATQQAVHAMFTALMQMLDTSGFTNAQSQHSLVPRLRRFFARARLDTMEAAIWHGVAATVTRRLQQKQVDTRNPTRETTP